MDAKYHEHYNFIVPESSRGRAHTRSRFMSEIFRILPDRDEYADYYESIPEPEALDLIAVSLVGASARGNQADQERYR